MSNYHPAQLDSDELLELHEYHCRERRKTMSGGRRVHHAARAAHFIGLLTANQLVSNIRAIRAPKDLHSYTHAPDGALVRLDVPSDDEI